MTHRRLTPLLVLASCLLVSAKKEESLAEMKGRIDAARPEEQISLGIQIARKQLEAIAEATKINNADGLHSALADLLNYAGKASDTSLQTNRKIKDTEIALRKIAEKLRDLKRSADFDEQAPLEEASDRVETMRTQLLSRMFGKKESK
jgi:hypothetical protein